MDREKTGRLIARVRKERGLTQKELANALHVSDRAVSKWERGAGFPDISLLEPLAQALGLQVLDLLRGERGEEPSVPAAVSQTLEAVGQARKSLRRERLQTVKNFCLSGLILWCALALLGLARLPVDRTVTAGVYQYGSLTALTQVRVKGWMVFGVLPWDMEYQGRFWIPLDKTAGRVRFTIPVQQDEQAHATHKSWSGTISPADRPFIGNRFCLTPGMEAFSLDLTDGTVIATSWEEYDRFVETYGGIPLPVIE